MLKSRINMENFRVWTIGTGAQGRMKPANQREEILFEWINVFAMAQTKVLFQGLVAYPSIADNTEYFLDITSDTNSSSTSTTSVTP